MKLKNAEKAKELLEKHSWLTQRIKDLKDAAIYIGSTRLDSDMEIQDLAAESLSKVLNDKLKAINSELEAL